MDINTSQRVNNSFNKSLLGLTHQQAAYTHDEPTDLRRQLAALRLLSTIKMGNIDATSKSPKIVAESVPQSWSDCCRQISSRSEPHTHNLQSTCEVWAHSATDPEYRWHWTVCPTWVYFLNSPPAIRMCSLIWTSLQIAPSLSFQGSFKKTKVFNSKCIDVWASIFIAKGWETMMSNRIQLDDRAGRMLCGTQGTHCHVLIHPCPVTPGNGKPRQ